MLQQAWTNKMSLEIKTIKRMSMCVRLCEYLLTYQIIYIEIRSNFQGEKKENLNLISRNGDFYG